MNPSEQADFADEHFRRAALETKEGGAGDDDGRDFAGAAAGGHRCVHQRGQDFHDVDMGGARFALIAEGSGEGADEGFGGAINGRARPGGEGES